MAAARNDSGEAAGARLLSGRFKLWIKSWAPVAAIAFATALCALFAGDPLESQERQLHDWLLRSRARSGLAPKADPLVVHLDLTSADPGAATDLASEYKDAAAIIDEASELRASAIVFDVVFGRGGRETAQPILDAIEKARGRNCAVVLAEFLRADEERARSFPFRERMQPAGLIHVKSDADGVFRRYALLQSTSDGVEPSLALAAYLAWRKVDWTKDVAVSGPGGASWDELSADSTTLETRRAGFEDTLLNFRVPWETRGPAASRGYTRAQLQSIYDSKQELPSPSASPFANRVIFVSYVGPGIGDSGTTPLGINQPRELLHITALNDLIQQCAVRQLPKWGEAAAFALLLVLGCVARLCRRTWWLLALWLVVALGVLGLSFGMLVRANWVFSGVAMTTFWSVLIGAELIRRRPAIQAQQPQPVAASGLGQQGDSAPMPKDAIFISYAREDYAAARRLEEDLRAAGLPVWLDAKRLRPGENYERSLEDAVKGGCSFFLSLISPVTEGQAEAYFHKERRWAAERMASIVTDGIFYVPILVDPTIQAIGKEPPIFSKVNWVRLDGGVASPEFIVRLRRLLELYRAHGRPHGDV